MLERMMKALLAKKRLANIAVEHTERNRVTWTAENIVQRNVRRKVIVKEPGKITHYGIAWKWIVLCVALHFRSNLAMLIRVCIVPKVATLKRKRSYLGKIIPYGTEPNWNVAFVGMFSLSKKATPKRENIAQ
jgi:hypothetical protein